ncbi:MAG: YbaK/EbsC family protein [bacterium]|nr:YbaK/EbsC family protein [bacterium]
MAVQRLVNFLEQNHIVYSTQKHDPAYSAFSSAKTAHVPCREMVKSILLKMDGTYSLVVLPSTSRIDFKKLKEVTGTHSASIADIENLEEMFPDCVTGAIPPLGNLYHLPVITDSQITEHEDMFFEAGNHREIMKINLRDFIKLSHPRIATIHKN